MRKLVRIILIGVLSVTVCACGGNDNDVVSSPASTMPAQTDEPSSLNGELMFVRQTLIETPYIASVGYLGLFDGFYEDLNAYLDYAGFNEYYSFLEEIPEEQYIELEGDQLYFVVPRDEDAEIYVYEWIIDEYNDYMGEPGDVLFGGCEGEALLIKGNISEYVPNFMIEIVSSEGSVLQYTPVLSGMDGTLVTPYEEPWISDDTPYDHFEEMYGISYSFDESLLYLYESWVSTVCTSEGKYYDISLTFYEDGTVDFSYGPSGDLYEYYYEGIFVISDDPSYPDNTYIFEFYLTDDYSDEQNGEDIYSVISFSSEPGSDGISMNFCYGDPFGYEDYESEYYLTPSIG